MKKIIKALLLSAVILGSAVGCQETNISTFYDQTINWCALGDSITYGVYASWIAMGY